MARLGVLDTETTGLPHQSNCVAILQIAVIIVDSADPKLTPIDKFSRMLQIPADADLQPYAMYMHRQHGRNQGHYRNYGDNPAATFEDLYDFLASHKIEKQKVIPCGHNAGPFDVPLLLRSAYRYGVDLGTVLDHHVIDTAGMAFDRFGVIGSGELESVSLRKLAPFLGVEFDDKAAHEAMYDAEITLECLRRMKTASYPQRDTI